MFKGKQKFRSIAKKSIAKLLALTMTLTSVASTTMAISTAYAEPKNNISYGQDVVNEAIRITSLGTPYKWGGWAEGPNGGVDCRGFVGRTLMNVFGTNKGYLVDNSGAPILDGTNKRIEVDLNAYNDFNELSPYRGKRICIENPKTHLKSYYKVLAADFTRNLGNTLDLPMGSYMYSSLIAYASQFPGSIIAHNGHTGFAIGKFSSEQDLINKHPRLNGRSSGTNGGNIIRWSQNAVNIGNGYPSSDYRHYFGKSVYLSACSEESGIRADNFTTSGKTPRPSSTSTLTILQCENEPQTSAITFKKIDSASKKILPGAIYGIYSDPSCKNLLTQFTTSTESVVVTIEKGKYYVKEIKAPHGYQLSNDVIPIDVTNVETKNVTLYDNPTNATIIVKKVDESDRSKSLPNTKLKVLEYNYKTKGYTPLVDLTYSNVGQMFTIATPYKNSEGVTYKDNSLHFSQTNQGFFKLVEESAQEGYINSKYEKVFNVKDGALRLVGDKAITNKPKYSLLINKVSVDGKPLQGAQFAFDYEGETYKGTTNEKGQLLLKDIPAGAINTGILYEVFAPEGYFPTDNYIEGQSISFTKDKLVDGCFQSEIKVINGTAAKPPIEVKEGTLIIKKEDFSQKGEVVQGATYNVYKDQDLKTLAKTNDGKVLENLVTNEKGEIVIDKLPVGSYFIREKIAANNYAIQLKTFAVDLLSDYVENGKLVVTTQGIGDERQTLQLNLQKVDEASKKPIKDTIYALYNKSELTSTTRKVVPSNTLLGYYKTNEQGMINAGLFGSEAFSVGEKTFEKVNVEVDGTSLNNLPLVNGQYYFKEVQAAPNFIIDTTPIEIDGSWKQNTTNNDVVDNGDTIGIGGTTLNKATKVVSNKRQGLVIDFEKGEKGATSKPKASKLNRTLLGAEYRLVNKEDIVDINTMETIPQGTILGNYKTNEQGMFTIDTFNEGAYKGHKVPNGLYELIEIKAPQGYIVNHTPITIDGRWQANNQNLVVKLQAKGEDEALKQRLKIKKVSSKDDKPLPNVKFQLFNVEEVLTKANIKAEELPWNAQSPLYNGFRTINREKFSQLIKTHNLTPVDNKTYTTNDKGEVETNEQYYGDYIIYEVEVPEGYTCNDLYYIQLPWVEHTMADSKYYVHDLQEQPTTPYTQVITNTIIPKETMFGLTITKIDSETKKPITNNPAKFELYDSQGNKITQNGSTTFVVDNNGQFSLKDFLPTGTYKLKEIEAPNNYIKGGDITLKVTKDKATATRDGKEIECNFTMMDNILNILLNVENTPKLVTTTLISKYETIESKATHVVGATLQLLDKKGEVVVLEDGTKCEWTTGKESDKASNNLPAHKIVGLKPGEYTLHEKVAPQGYQKAKDIKIVIKEQKATQEFSIENKPTQVEIEKIDSVSKTPLVGAQLVILNKDKTPYIKDGKELSFVSSKTPYKISYLPHGEYYLHEKVAPQGYQKSQDIKFEVVDSEKPIKVTMMDNRTYGQIEINKVDSKTHKPLEGVEFNLISKEKVVDPITNETILYKSQVVDTLVTNEQGYAISNKQLPIGIYDENGYLDTIKYLLVETKPLGGQYDANAIKVDVAFNYIDDHTPIVKLKFDIENHKPNVVVTKHGTPKTFEGNYKDKNNVTIVKNGDEIEYTINVQNTGDSSAWNVVVKDKIPENTRFLSAPKEHHAEYDEKTNTMYWTIDEVKAGQNIPLKFKVTANSKNACEIVNVAQYDMPDKVPTRPEDYLDPKGENNWKDTNSVVHQIIEVHKSASYDYGTNEKDSVFVDIGTIFDYSITITNTNPIYNLSVKDPIPSGLEFVKGSAKYQQGDKVVELKELDVNKENTLVFPTLDEVPAGTTTFTFSVKVEVPEPFDEEVYFINKGEITTSTNKDNDKFVKLETETISHKTKKPSIPWIPIEPAKPIIPWTPIEPAKPIIPWTPIEPAKPIVPWLPIEPAKPIIPWKPLEPSKPITPMTPLEPSKPSAPQEQTPQPKPPILGLTTSDRTLLWSILACLSAGTAIGISFYEAKKKKKAK